MDGYRQREENKRTKGRSRDREETKRNAAGSPPPEPVNESIVNCRRAVFEESWSQRKDVLIGSADVRPLSGDCKVDGK